MRRTTGDERRALAGALWVAGIAAAALFLLALLAGPARATVPATADFVKYDCDGSDTVFPFGFGVWDTSEVRVVRVAADGTETVLVETRDYTVALPNDDGWLSPGGTVTTTAAYAATEDLWIFRELGWTQESVWSTKESMDLEALEDDFDRAAVRDRQLLRRGRRALRSPDTEATDMNLPAGWSESSGSPWWNATTERWGMASSNVPDVGASDLWAGVLTQSTLGNSLTALGLGSEAGNRTIKLALYDAWANVKDYGAVGDGVADDAAAIQEAINENLGKSIVFPPGTYAIGQTLIVGGVHTKLIGMGWETVIRTTADCTAIQLGDDAHRAYGSYVESLRVEAGVSVPVTSVSCGILFYNDAYKSVIRDCFIGYTADQAAGWFARGIEFGGRGGFGSTIENCLIRYNFVNIYRADNGSRIVGNWIQGGRHGIVLGSVDPNNDPSLADTSTTTGVPGYGVVIQGNIIEDLSHPTGMAYGLFVKHTSDFPNVRSNYFESIGREHDGQEDGVAIQVSFNDGSGHYLVRGGCINNCLFSDIGQAIKINGAWWGGDLSGNRGYYLNAGTCMIDASEHYASGMSRLTIGEQYGFAGEVENPTTRIAVVMPERATQYIGQTAKTTDYTVTLADSGKLITNGGATGAVTCTLPAASTGGYCRWGFRKEADKPFFVAPASGLRFQGLAANEPLKLPAVGDEFWVEVHQSSLTSYVVVKSSTRQSYLPGSQDVNNVTADLVDFDTRGTHIINSSSGPIAGTLADGSAVGQTVKFICKVAGNNIDITVAHHVTSDPEVIRLDAAKEWVELVWDGTDWVEVGGNGQTYP